MITLFSTIRFLCHQAESFIITIHRDAYTPSIQYHFLYSTSFPIKYINFICYCLIFPNLPTVKCINIVFSGYPTKKSFRLSLIHIWLSSRSCLPVTTTVAVVPAGQMFSCWLSRRIRTGTRCAKPVSYTHLDVYKRQALMS